MNGKTMKKQPTRKVEFSSYINEKGEHMCDMYTANEKYIFIGCVLKDKLLPLLTKKQQKKIKDLFVVDGDGDYEDKEVVLHITRDVYELPYRNCKKNSLRHLESYCF